MKIHLRIAAAILFMCVAGSAHAAEPRYYSGYVGSLPQAENDLARTYFKRPEARKLLHMLETRAVSRTEAEAALLGTQTSLADLLRVKLVSEDAGGVHIGFAFFTAADMRIIHSVAAQHVPSLVAAYREAMPRFDSIFAQYPASVDRKVLAFVTIAGFGLNWDALDFLEHEHYRKPILVSGNGWQYSFWASEDTPDYSYKDYYWGSSSSPADSMNLGPLDVTFSSFGDPDSDPRMNFPDLFAEQPADMTAPVRAAATSVGLRHDTHFNLDINDVLGFDLSRSVADVLFQLRKAPALESDLCAHIENTEKPRCGALLSLLAVTGYITADGPGRYRLSSVVFDMEDKPALEAALALNRSILGTWLKDNYSKIQSQLTDITAVRQGVAYDALFTQIWHELFGLASRALVESGAVANPRAPSSPSPGSLPVVWRTAIYHHDWR